MFHVRTAAWDRLERMKWRWRSAEFHSAVSQSCTLRGSRPAQRVQNFQRAAECNSAIQQSVTLRYEKKYLLIAYTRDCGRGASVVRGPHYCICRRKNWVGAS